MVPLLSNCYAVLSHVSVVTVIVGETHNYSYDRMQIAINCVRKGARLIGTNLDVFDRGQDGVVLFPQALTSPFELTHYVAGVFPGTACLVAPVELATGVKAYYLGTDWHSANFRDSSSAHSRKAKPTHAAPRHGHYWLRSERNCSHRRSVSPSAVRVCTLTSCRRQYGYGHHRRNGGWSGDSSRAQRCFDNVGSAIICLSLRSHHGQHRRFQGGSCAARPSALLISWRLDRNSDTSMIRR
jgi:hypothetical protein